jgi:membrane fusion protein, multidrug efflux system
MSVLCNLTPRKSALLGTALLAGLALAGDLGYGYWQVGRFLQSTDDAYVHADYTTVAPKISGYVTEVLVRDNQAVKAGQVLARIDRRDLEIALARAQAEVENADALLSNLDARIAQQQAAIDQQRADIAGVEATLEYAKAENVRHGDLKKAGYGSVQRAELAESAVREKIALLQRNLAGLHMAERKVDILTSEHARAEAQRDESLASRQQAELNLAHTSIMAPVDGMVAARSLRIGQYVRAGTPLMAVVPLQTVYVIANFKETQVAGVRDGQPVEIRVDSFPGIALKGHVDSLSPASAQVFALLPPDNATGNFTKIVQRVPVRIVIDDDELAGRLRPGMSVDATVDTRP